MSCSGVILELWFYDSGGFYSPRMKERRCVVRIRRSKNGLFVDLPVLRSGTFSRLSVLLHLFAADFTVAVAV